MNRIESAITRAIRDANQRLPADRRIADVPDAVLFGEAGPLDSLGLINLLVAVEQEIENETGIEIDLVNDVDELADKGEAFETVSALARHVAALLEEAGRGAYLKV